MQKQFEVITALDCFSASGQESARGLLQVLRDKCKLGTPGHASVSGKAVLLKDLKNRIWVTRKSVHIDRIGCAWLIKRFIEKEAKFRFVIASEYKPGPREHRFDMFEAEFTHEGDKCCFEVFIEKLNLRDAALREIAEIIHDIDLKD